MARYMHRSERQTSLSLDSRWQSCAGPIPGLRLPRAVWAVLAEENITTLDQLRAVADEIERFERIGSQMAQRIRDELARVAGSDERL